jgi:hypothetical protein
MIFFIISLIRSSSASDYYLHLVYITVLSAVFAQMIILIVYTPSIKNCFTEIRNNCVLAILSNTNQTQSNFESTNLR